MAASVSAPTGPGRPTVGGVPSPRFASPSRNGSILAICRLLAGAALTPDVYACAVSFAGVSDLPKMLKEERARYGKDSQILSFWISRIGSSFDDSEQLRATSPARRADKIKCPVLLMHGEGDTTVPIEQSEIMADAMKSAGKPVEFIRFPGEDHYLNLADTRIRFLKETAAFLEKNIGK